MNVWLKCIVILALLPMTGCNKKGEQPGPGGADKIEPDSPQPAPASVAGGLSGKVIETMNAAGYSYLKLDTSTGQRWAAVQKTQVTKGSTVTVVNAVEMKNFKSRTLDRTFPSIYFGALSSAGPARAPRLKGDPHAGIPMPKDKVSMAHNRLGKGKQAFDKPIPRAPGGEGRTISAVHAERSSLKGKPIAVRGKVTKFNAGIMGKNWIHLQDGSGSAEKNDFDLTVTTKAKATVGDVLVVRGIVNTDRDFGAGYRYAVIIEDATLVK